MERLTPRQRQILDVIKDQVIRKGYPPSVREIGDAVGLASSSTVHAHLETLERLGFIRRDPTKPRAIELLDPAMPNRELVNVPLVGRVTAGQPILAVENIEDYFPVSRELLTKDEAFMLRVKGDSMINAGILDGDYVFVHPQSYASNGDIVVALIGDEATVKRFFRENGHVRLQAENPAYDPIITTEVSVLGKVVGVYRQIR
ncbi:MAG: transcriptional repressor LexA [Firmicutes bacterium]|nr:transcriptional repressor LexA [Bacillota bacterium]